MFEFKVKWYYNSELVTSRGLVAGAFHYDEAMKKVQEQFGEENIMCISLTTLTVNECIATYKEGVKSLKEYFEEDC